MADPDRQTELLLEQLAETESRFRNMADVAPVMLWMSGTDGLCTFFNQTWLTFAGRTLEEEQGEGWAEGVYSEDFQRCLDTYNDAFNRHQVFEMEYRLRRKDGQYRWILDRGTPRYTPDGSFAGFIGSCVDITERKELESGLRQAVQVRDEFLSIASHELRTPLTSLQLQLESMLRTLDRSNSGDARDTRIVHNASVALQKTLHMGTMINVLLDVSRISEGHLALEYGEHSAAQLVCEVVDNLRETAAEARCNIETKLHGEPRGSWDRFRFEQILTNLLSNAIKYGAGKPVEVDVRETGECVRIAVRDHGPGLPAEQHERIFERFVRFASSRHYAGFGLGLWITRELVKAHGGRIEVQSRPGEGAAFVLELPLQPPSGSPKNEAVQGGVA